MGSTPDIVVLGAHGSGGNMVTIDHVPAPGESIIARDYRVFKDGGKGAHQAMVACRLGATAAFIGKMPVGPRSDTAVQWLVDDGVNVEHLLREGDEPAHAGLIMIDRDRVSTIVSIPGQRHLLTLAESQGAIRGFTGAAVFVTGFEIPVATALGGARLARQLGMLTLLNPSPIALEPLGTLDYIDVLVPNEAEASALAGAGMRDEVPPLQLAAMIRERYAVGTVVITLGAGGACACDGERTWFVPPVAVDAVCTTGAGDTFLGTLAWALAKGRPMQEALHYGNCAAAVSVSRDGTIDSFPTLSDVEQLVRTHQAPMTG